MKAVRASCRTFQLFEITKAVLEKNDRFVVVVQRVRPQAGEGGQSAKPEPMYMSLPDHLPFDTEDAAIQHVLGSNLGAFFDTQEVEIEAPKGNFPIINKCGITGELLGPPNYHRYQQILQQHYASKLTRMPRLAVWQIPAEQSLALAKLAARSMQLQVTVQDGGIYVSTAEDSVEITPIALKVAQG